jgi:hypothetical protein
MGKRKSGAQRRKSRKEKAAKAAIGQQVRSVPSLPNRRPVMHVYADASGFASGGHLGRPAKCLDAYAQSLSATSRDTDIQFREMLATLTGCRKWGGHSSGKHMVVHSDNRGICIDLERGWSRNESIQDMIDEIYALSAAKDFTFGIKWVASKANWLADALSRLKWGRIPPHVVRFLPHK